MRVIYSYVELYTKDLYTIGSRDYYIGHSYTCGVTLTGIPGELSLLFQYKDPSDILDVSLMEAGGVTSCVVARLFVSSRSSCLGESAVGYICHMLIESPTGNELVTRIWLGDIERVSSGWPPATLVSWLGNTYVGRCSIFSRDIAVAVWKHCIEMTTCLRAFLPKFYSNITGNRLEQSTARSMKPSKDAKSTAQRRVLSVDAKKDDGDDDDSSLGSIRIASDSSSHT